MLPPREEQIALMMGAEERIRAHFDRWLARPEFRAKLRDLALAQKAAAEQPAFAIETMEPGDTLRLTVPRGAYLFRHDPGGSTATLAEKDYGI